MQRKVHKLQLYVQVVDVSQDEIENINARCSNHPYRARMARLDPTFYFKIRAGSSNHRKSSPARFWIQIPRTVTATILRHLLVAVPTCEETGATPRYSFLRALPLWVLLCCLVFRADNHRSALLVSALGTKLLIVIYTKVARTPQRHAECLSAAAPRR